MVSVHSLSDASFITTGPVKEEQQSGGVQNPESPTTPAATSTPRPTTATSMNFGTAAAGGGGRESTYTMDNLPPVPPIPEDLLNGQSEARDFARPKTAPNGAVKKSRSVKSGVSRGRSGDRRRGTGLSSSKPDFTGFLDSIGVEDDEDDLESVGSGISKAPY